MASNTKETIDVDDLMDRFVTIRKGDQKLHVLLTYTALNALYSGEACLMAIHGKEDAGPNDLGTIVFPIRAKDVTIEPDVHDAVPFSYANLKDGVIRLRHVTAKIGSEGGKISTSCTLTVDVPSVDSNWVPRTKNVTLVVESGLGPDGETNRALFNPHGMAEWGRYLFFIDYETRHLVRVRKSLLEAAGDGGNVVVDTYDMSDILDDVKARGQAIIIMGNKIYALYLSADLELVGGFGPSHLLRLDIDPETGIPDEDTAAHTFVGRNAQSISPIKVNGIVHLLVQAVGGEQLFTGATNGIYSNVCVVEAEGEWPDNATIKLTDDLSAVSASGEPTPGTYDFIAIGAGMRDGASLVYFLTQVYNTGASSAYWQLYVCTAAAFLAIPDETTITDALAIGGGLVEAPTVLVANTPVPYAIYFWGLLYEQALGSDASEDRLWVGVGSPFQVCKATQYSSPTTAPDYPYVVISGMGGKNVNGWQSLIETLHQAIRKVSLNRGMQGMKIALQPSKPGTDK